jgi:hypothetical protein
MTNILNIGEKLFKFSKTMISFSILCLITAYIIPVHFKSAIEHIGHIIPAEFKTFFLSIPLTYEDNIEIFCVSTFINLLSLIIFVIHKMTSSTTAKSSYEIIAGNMLSLNSVALVIILLISKLYKFPCFMDYIDKDTLFYYSSGLFVTIFAFIHFGYPLILLGSFIKKLILKKLTP